MTETQTQLQQAFPDWAWQWDVQLAQSTYFKIGGRAEAVIHLDTAEAVADLVKFCAQHQIRLTTLGGASNVIVDDAGVTGVVLYLESSQIELGEKTATHQRVRVGAGCKMPLLVSQTVAAGLAGLEYFLGVPGTVGGAVYNNAHYLSHLIGEYVTRIQVVDKKGEMTWVEAAEAGFEYDHSRFQTSQEIIFAIEFSLPFGDRAASQALIKQATEYRAETQPLGEPSSGCIFQNVPNNSRLQELFPQFAHKSHVPGGFIIDQAGLKGRRVGGVEVSHKHAAFFVNKGGGTAQDVRDLVKIVKQTVYDKFGVQLQEEVFYIPKPIS